MSNVYLAIDTTTVLDIAGGRVNRVECFTPYDNICWSKNYFNFNLKHTIQVLSAKSEYQERSVKLKRKEL